jgi:hypothetical protein
MRYISHKLTDKNQFCSLPKASAVWSHCPNFEPTKTNKNCAMLTHNAASSTVLILFYQAADSSHYGIFERAKEQFSPLSKFIMVEVGNNPEVVNSFGVSRPLLPVLVELRNGKETWRHEGAFGFEDIAQRLVSAKIPNGMAT